MNITGFSYDNEGNLYREGKLINNKPAKSGYMRVSIDGTHRYVHRIIFLLCYGYLPELIDHKDRNKLNNRPDNLRDADVTLNNRNVGLSKNNNSGIKGVSFNIKRNKWVASITANRSQRNRRFDTKVGAVLQRLQWEHILWR